MQVIVDGHTGTAPRWLHVLNRGAYGIGTKRRCASKLAKANAHISLPFARLDSNGAPGPNDKQTLRRSRPASQAPARCKARGSSRSAKHQVRMKARTAAGAGDEGCKVKGGVGSTEVEQVRPIEGARKQKGPARQHRRAGELRPARQAKKGGKRHQNRTRVQHQLLAGWGAQREAGEGSQTWPWWLLDGQVRHVWSRTAAKKPEISARIICDAGGRASP